MTAPVLIVSVDLAGRSGDTCFAALDLAWRLKARVVLVHASRLAPGMRADTQVLDAEGTETTAGDLLDADARKHAAPLLTLFQEGNVDVELEVGRGALADVLVDAAARHKAVLIVVGVEPRSGLGRVLKANPAEALVHVAPCPVTLVRARRGDDAGFSTAQFQMMAETDG